MAELDAYFGGQPGVRRLRSKTASAAAAEDSWLLSIDAVQDQVPITLSVDAGFPFSMPRLQLQSGSRFLVGPHVDELGFLCLTPNQATFSTSRPVELVQYLLREARTLLEAGAAQSNREDFVVEFQSYWGRKVPSGARVIWSLLKPGAPARKIVFTETRGATLVAEDENSAREWLGRREPAHNGGEYVFQPTVLLWLPTPLWPADYPRTNKAVAEVAARSGDNALAMLSANLPADGSTLPLVIGFATPNGAALAGVRLGVPTKPSADPHCRARSRTHQDGFRMGRVPPAVLASRVLSATPVRLARVERVDPGWIHSRESGDPGAALLRSKRVAIIGCGSLGADVALLLAKAGVGGLLLIDDDLLRWENIGRHLLGADSVGKKKAEVLSGFLSRQLPHQAFEFEPRTWEALYAAEPTKLEGYDLIVSTTGEWASDAALNLVARTSLRFPRILFGWTEPHGCAGHALLVADSGGCLACGFDELGHFANRVTQWPDGAATLNRGAACGQFYQPYGSVDVGPLKSLIAERAIDSLLERRPASYWSACIGSLQRLQEMQGELRSEWRVKLGADLGGLRVVSSAWPINPACELCR